MKKMLLLLVVGALIAFASCSKVCSCTEKKSTIKVEIDLKSETDLKNCSEVQTALNEAAVELEADQDWSCTNK